jgi:hypothetical protein
MNEWISVKDKLPNHHNIILVYYKKGIGVTNFVDSIKMNETLWRNGYGDEAVDIKKNPYFFVSQEVRQHTFNDITHWMPLPEMPKDNQE